MAGLTLPEILYSASAFVFYAVLIAHFALRKWRFNLALRWGWIVYALSLPAAGVSLALLLGGAPWWAWTAGFLYLVWAVFGFTVEYLLKIEWRSPIRWPIFIPFILLYLATSMFYWWPLARVFQPFWYAAGVLFVLATYLNVTSHQEQVVHP